MCIFSLGSATATGHATPCDRPNVSQPRHAEIWWTSEESLQANIDMSLLSHLLSIYVAGVQRVSDSGVSGLHLRRHSQPDFMSSFIFSKLLFSTDKRHVTWSRELKLLNWVIKFRPRVSFVFKFIPKPTRRRLHTKADAAGLEP
jgi:hypothetical protein